MNCIIKYRKYLFVFLLSFVMFFGLFLCGVVYSKSTLIFFVFWWLISFVFINFVIFHLSTKIRKERKAFFKKKKEFSFKIKTCLDKMTDHYNIIEINKISFGIYHDLSNILTAFNLSLGQLKAKIIDQKNELDNSENVHRDLVDISTKAFSLVSFLRDQYKQKMRLDNFKISEEIKNCLMLFNFYFTKYSIKIKLILEDNLFLFSNKVKFSQLIINLISNSIDSLKQKKIGSSRKINIKLFKNNDFIYLIFKDNGIGIDLKDLSSIFDPFFSSKTNKDNNINCGLGLFSCKRIVERDFSGRIKVKSDLGRGAKFIIRIPLNSV